MSGSRVRPVADRLLDLVGQDDDPWFSGDPSGAIQEPGGRRHRLHVAGGPAGLGAGSRSDPDVSAGG